MTILPPNESQRLNSLHALNILDTLPEERFDRITRTARRLFNVPIGLIGLVDAKREWFRSCQGLAIGEISREVSLSAYAILGDDALLIPDTLDDARFADSPLVIGYPYVRFYAGQPLSAPDGSKLGALCIMDRQPRQMGEADLMALRDLAAWTERELNSIELSRALIIQREGDERFRQLAENCEEVFWIHDLAANCITYINPAYERVWGRSRQSLYAQPQSYLEAIHAEDRQRVSGSTNGEEYRVVRPDGSIRWVRSRALPMQAGNGTVYRIAILSQDITKQKRLEQDLAQARQQAAEAATLNLKFLSEHQSSTAAANAGKHHGFAEEHKQTILLAEDHPVNRRLTSLQLQLFGYDVHAVMTGQQALDAFLSRRSAYRLILMDCHMPQMDGLEATRRIRQAETGSGHHVPIIAMTANVQEKDRQDCLAAGMDDYIAKPVDLDRLGTVIAQWWIAAPQ